MERAACAGHAPRAAGEPDLWFDYAEGRGDWSGWEARMICVGCTVREPCLRSAFLTDHSLRHGIYGGTLPEERVALLRQADRIRVLMQRVDVYGQRMARAIAQREMEGSEQCG